MDLVWSALLLFPLVAFRYAPAADLPYHVAISHITARLLGHDPGLSTLYALNIQPVPYHLAYVILTPCVALFGPHWGGAVFLLVYGALFLAGVRALIQELGCPAAAYTAAGLLVYNSHFFWGFLPSLIALPAIVWAAWSLLAYGRSCASRYLLLSYSLGVLVGCSHIVMIPVFGVVILSCVVTNPRRLWRCALGTAIAATIPLLPWLVTTSQIGTLTMSLVSFRPRQSLLYAGNQLRLFDSEWGMWTLGAVLLLLLLGVGLEIAALTTARGHRSGWRQWADENRFALTLLGATVLLYMVTPIRVSASGMSGWGVSFRYIVFVGLGLVLLYPRNLARRRASILAAAVALATLCHVGSLYWFWYAFDRDTRPIDEIFDSIESDSTLGVVFTDEGRFQTSWAPVQRHVHAYAVAQGVAFDSAIFMGSHLPIRVQRQPTFDLRGKGPWSLGELDYVLVHGSPDNESPGVSDGRLLVRAGRWELYGSATLR